MLYHRREGFWKNSFAIKASCVLAIYTESNHECTLSEPTAVAYSADWFYPDICPANRYLGRTSVRPWNMLYQGPQGSSTPGKPVLPWISVDIFAISTGSNHDYTHSEHTTVALSPDWLHLDTFRPMGDAVPQTRKLLDTWKNGCAIKASQCSGHSTGSDHDDTHSEFSIVA